MDKQIMRVLVLCCMLNVCMGVGETDISPSGVENWIKSIKYKKEKITKFQFFIHDTVTGENPSAFPVAQSNISFTTPTFFGLVIMFDDPITVGPELNSGIVGRAQGYYGLSSLEERSLTMNMNLLFTGGDYNGSTLTVVGRNPLFNRYREMSVVGGSGLFRLARGIATAQTSSSNASAGNFILKYNLIVLHY